MAAATPTLELCPYRANLCIVRGDSPVFEFALKQDTITGAPIDITGRTYTLTVDTREEPDDDSTNSFAIAGTVPTGTDGIVRFQPTTVQTALLTPGTPYFFDVQQTNGAEVRTIIRGEVEVQQDITKA